ncbi:MAG: J domain-containing protein [Pseudomonadota bacterium]
MSQSLYDRLGVKKAASQDEVARAYRNLAKKYHPDTNPGDQKAEDKFKEISAAYEILKDKDTRRRYDRGEIDEQGTERAPMGGYWHTGADPRSQSGFEFRTSGSPGGGSNTGFGGFDDIINELFSRSGRKAEAGGEFRGFHAPGADVRYSLQVDFLTAVRGGKERVTLPEGRTLDVNIPAGVTDGQVLRLKRQGGAGLAGGPNGDALIEIRIKPHPRFSRDGLDVVAEQEVPLSAAVLGEKIRIETLDGDLSVQIPEFANSGRKLRLRGRGIKDAKTGQIGDLYLKLMIALPPEGDKEHRQALRAWAERQTDRTPA